MKAMQDQDKLAEEELIKKAMEISLQQEQLNKMENDEEEEMIRRVMEMSEREEKDRQARMKSKQDNENLLLLQQQQLEEEQ